MNLSRYASVHFRFHSAAISSYSAVRKYLDSEEVSIILTLYSIQHLGIEMKQ